ncbi:hypothetical protein [Aquimarina agarivorans]|uniref:hypothetical protein n=1 Tax=Aquimarina agarivorans TaxID=980584 RepID=UPI0004974468|nr:hypothetical protein [Aquimarina agarivorans]
MSFLFAQRMELNGKISADSIAVHIYNISQNKGTINNNKGEFKIRLNLNDTLFFSSIQHVDYKLIITQKEIENPYVEIELETKVEALNEVFISSSGLSGDLNNDLLKIPTDPYIDGSIFGGTPVKPVTRTEARLRNQSIGAVTKIVNTLNGKIKRAKRDVALENKDILIRKVTSRFSKEFFNKALQISEGYIQDFMNYCGCDKRFESLTTPETTLNLVEFLKEKSMEYKKLKQTK